MEESSGLVVCLEDTVCRDESPSIEEYGEASENLQPSLKTAVGEINRLPRLSSQSVRGQNFFAAWLMIVCRRCRFLVGELVIHCHRIKLVDAIGFRDVIEAIIVCEILNLLRPR